MDDARSKAGAPPIAPEEVRRLAQYAARHGLEPELVELLTRELRREEPDWPVVMEAYTRLTAATDPVNGRGVLDSETRSLERMAGIGALTLVFFVLAVGNEIADLWLADVLLPEEQPRWYAVKFYVWDYLTPFFWGGLGSCVYLLKRIQDKAADLEYEHARLCGWLPRILIGAILGATLQFVYDPSSFVDGGVHLDANAVAFLVGVGVKVVYGALEKAIDVLAAQLGLDALRRQRTRPTPGPAGEGGGS